MDNMNYNENEVQQQNFGQEQGAQQENREEQEIKQEMKRIKRNKYTIVILLLVIIAGLSIGFAALSSQLKVQGTSTISDSTWDIGIDDDGTGGTGGIEVPSGETATINPSNPESLTPDDGIPTPENPNPNGAIIWMDGNTVYFKHILKQPGDIFTFNVTYTNNGTINAKVANVTKSELNATAKNFMTYTATYSNGNEINEGDVLNAGSSVTYRITVEFKSGITTLPTAAELALINETAQGHTGATSLFTVTYEQA